MLYFNKVSQQTIPLPELCRAENTSIAAGLPFGQWLPVTQDPYPSDAQEGAIYDLAPVVLRDGAAFQPWVQIEVVVPPEPVV